MRFKSLSVALVMMAGLPAVAHEFWIEPQQYQVGVGEQLVANLKNGEEFQGVSLAWFDRNFSRFDMISGNDIRPVTARLGDTPAMDVETWTPGLMVIVHETTPASLTYTDWSKFLKFAAHKDFSNAEADHLANGWSQERFRESYTRHVKALVAVGDGAGEDRSFGLETEIVALSNPYAEDFTGDMRVRVEYNGAPRPDVQLEVFEKSAEGDVAITLYRTDAGGVAQVPVKAGHSYLFDAVVLRPNPASDGSDDAPVWHTLWAALTFAVPR